MTAGRRGALSLGAVALAGALGFLSGLVSSGAAEGAAAVLCLGVSFLAAAVTVIVVVRLILGTRKAEDVEAFLFVPAAFLGGALFAAFFEAFVLGVSVSLHEGWGDRELQKFGGSEMNWHSWISGLYPGAAIGGAIGGAFLGLAGWVSRFASWSEPAAKFPPN